MIQNKRSVPPPTKFGAAAPLAQAKLAVPSRGNPPPPPVKFSVSAPIAQAKIETPRSGGFAPPPPPIAPRQRTLVGALSKREETIQSKTIVYDSASMRNRNDRKTLFTKVAAATVPAQFVIQRSLNKVNVIQCMVIGIKIHGAWQNVDIQNGADANNNRAAAIALARDWSQLSLDPSDLQVVLGWLHSHNNPQSILISKLIAHIENYCRAAIGLKYL